MTNYNERLDEILRNHRGRVLTYHELFRKQHYNQLRLDADLAHADAVAKQALISLTKELVAGAKPRRQAVFIGTSESCVSGKEHNQAIDEYEQNLLKGLEGTGMSEYRPKTPREFRNAFYQYLVDNGVSKYTATQIAGEAELYANAYEAYQLRGIEYASRAAGFKPQAKEKTHDQL